MRLKIQQASTHWTQSHFQHCEVHPRYLHDLITVQPSRSTRSSALVTLLQPSVDSSLKITDRSFRYTAPHLWNRLPPTVRILYQSGPSSSPSSSPSSRSDPAPLVDLSRGIFHSHLKLSFSQSLSLYSHLSLPQADLLELWPLIVWQSLTAVVSVSAAD